MKILTLALMTGTIIIAACTSTKKVTTPTASVPANATVPFSPFVMAKPESGIHVPGDQELTAIREQYKEVTMDKLKEGYLMYTEGACIKCHDTQSIYKFTEVQWKNIIDDMAGKARLNEDEKDAVYKYVLAIKATQPKDATCQH